MASFGQNGFTDQSADLNVRVRAEFLSASPSRSGSKGAAPTAEWLQEDASVICARQMPDRWTVCEHILADYEGQIPTQGCLSPAARQKPFSMRCSACGRCMENVSPSSNSKWPGTSTRQDGGSRRLPRLSGWLDKVQIATQARGDSIERGPVEHPEKCSAVGQGIANQHQRSTRSSRLMNPGTVSQLLPLQPGLFDLVVFDEASQCPPEYAISSLYRGRRAVVA